MNKSFINPKVSGSVWGKSCGEKQAWRPNVQVDQKCV